MHYEFTITIGGDGKTVEEAWNDALDSVAYTLEDWYDNPPNTEKDKVGETEYFVKYAEKS